MVALLPTPDPTAAALSAFGMRASVGYRQRLGELSAADTVQLCKIWDPREIPSRIAWAAAYLAAMIGQEQIARADAVAVMSVIVTLAGRTPASIVLTEVIDLDELGLPHKHRKRIS